MNKMIKGLGLSLVLGASLNAQIFDNHQIGLNTGTLGLGIEYSTSINDMFALRTGLNAFDYSHSLNESGIDYDADLELKSISLILDYHPFSNGFRLSGGAIYNGNQLKVTGKPDGTGNIEINDVTYNSSQVGKVDGEVDFNSFAPYVGLGYSSSKTKESGFSFNTEIGAMFHGTPSAKLRATCSDPAICASLQSDLTAEEKQLNDDLKSFNIYPVLTMGIGYKF
jgi:hypothetical protein